MLVIAKNYQTDNLETFFRVLKAEQEIKNVRRVLDAVSPLEPTWLEVSEILDTLDVEQTIEEIYRLYEFTPVYEPF